MPKVSVIIPVYGVEKYIERCARSLFEQTLDDIEYLFIDDCTPDKSVEVLKRVLEEYPNRKDQVIIHRMNQNSGQAAVRKWGMQNATGEYVIHCDSDDWVDTDMYRAMYAKAKEEDADVVVCDYYETDGERKNLKKQDFKDYKPHVLFVYFQLWLRLVRRSIILENELIHPTGNMGEDRVYTVQTSWYAKKHVYLSQPLYYYYSNVNSICHLYSRESSVKNFKMRKTNTVTIEKFVNDNGIKGALPYINNLKLSSLTWLQPFLYDQQIRNLWNTSFPGLTCDILRTPCIGVNKILKHIIMSSSMYSVIIKFKNR